MSWKRNAIESVCWLGGRFAGTGKSIPDDPHSIFVLRNNDIGDLLVVTPLFDALKRRFPKARIIAGVGNWNVDVLKHNPHVDEILPVNAPWHNQQVRPQGVGAALRYLSTSTEVKELRKRKCSIGIDVLGSPLGSLLMMIAGVPWRLGVRGYAGGHTAVQQAVSFDGADHVGRSALRFAELLGGTDFPENRPQLFLTEDERAIGEGFWKGTGLRVVLAPGGGYTEKCWPEERFASLARELDFCEVAVMGGKKEVSPAERIIAANPAARNYAGTLGLRESFALVAAADIVVCNSSMAMHVAAAFRKPALVLLGPAFSSAKMHGQQWGYPESRVEGPEIDSRKIIEVSTALEVVREMSVISRPAFPR